MPWLVGSESFFAAPQVSVDMLSGVELNGLDGSTRCCDMSKSIYYESDAEMMDNPQ